jgi:hypothetical protein
MSSEWFLQMTTLRTWDKNELFAEVCGELCVVSPPNSKRVFLANFLTFQNLVSSSENLCSVTDISDGAGLQVVLGVKLEHQLNLPGYKHVI